MYGYGYSLYNRLAFLGSLDPDATAFFSATGITDPTIQGAINSLCVDLKTYGVWSKMKAIYPFVGGTATTHKFNLKDSRDLDAAFRLTFFGGWTHSSAGILPNGTNAYADTRLNTAFSGLTKTSVNLSIYSRTNSNSGQPYDIGNSSNLAGTADPTYLITRYSTNVSIIGIADQSFATSIASTDSTGFFSGGTNGSSTQKIFKNGNLIKTGTAGAGSLANQPLYIGANNSNGVASLFSNKQYAFSTIGDGLTDEDSANLYYSVQKFQTTLGRQVGTPIYSSNATDVNARLFLGATNIQDATITSAVDTLVQGLKTDGVWSKLKAVYPFVGGTATTHKFNLANALDEDSAFRLAFNGGLTHSSNGALGNGTNGFANTFIVPSTNLSQNSVSVSIYSRTDANGGADFGCSDLFGYLKVNNKQYFRLNQNTSFSIATNSIASSGLFSFNRTNSTQESLYKNGSLIETFNKNSITPFSQSMYILGYRSSEFSNKQFAFASIGDGLTATEVSNLYTRVQAFQTTLNRQV